ncbi:MAG: ABC transporter ATP-binding protein [Curvibacter sp.]|nr:MAG: ABC transporter ATP-binding protein [Curvibacter sp.]
MTDSKTPQTPRPAQGALSPAKPNWPASDLPVLSLQGLGKEYRLYDSPRARLKSLLLGGRHYRSHWVLRDVNFSLQRGQCMGVVGNNGAGKSSLLKLIAGTLRPSEGRLQRQGRVTAILELGAGFHPDFTGRENLFFGGRLIGISEAELAALADSIIEFSELGEAIDRPVKSYSSGMVVRLAFALITAVEPDVLIIDEALAVGDQNFQKKCIERIEAFRLNGCTILFCSHSMYHIRRLCDKSLWLDKGRVVAFGDTESVLSAYENELRKQEEQAKPAATPQGDAAPDAGEASAPALAPPRADGIRAEILSLEVAHLDASTPPLLTHPDLVVTVRARVAPGERPHFGVMLEQARGTGITSVTTQTDGVEPISEGEGLWRATVTFPDLPLHSGEYVLSAYLFDEAGLVVYEQWYQHLYFRVVYPSVVPGLVRLPHHWASS